MKVYLAGCGLIGLRLGSLLQDQGHDVVGLKRSSADADFSLYSVDLAESSAVSDLPHDADAIVFTVTPQMYTAEGYQQVYETILGNVVRWAQGHAKQPLVVLVSSTGVYGQQAGEWVDENSPTVPQSSTSQWIVFGEQLVQKELASLLIVRFSGIYGPERTRLIKRAISGEAIQKEPGLWTNRIHEDDCVSVLDFLLQRHHRGESLETVYNATDDMPITSYDVSAFICHELGKTLPPVKAKDLSTNLNKRVSNQRLKALGYVFHYPDYSSGYRSILSSTCV